MRIPIGSTIEDLKKLQDDGVSCVVIEADEDLKIPPSFYSVFRPGVTSFHHVTGEVINEAKGSHLVVRRPENYTSYVMELLNDLIIYPDEEIMVESFGRKASERTAIHNASSNLNMKVKCNYVRSINKYLITISKVSRFKNPFSWWSTMTNEFTEVEYEGSFTNFRAKVYRVAKNKNLPVQVTKSNSAGMALVRIKEGYGTKSLQVRFNEFLDTITLGESKPLPVEFRDSKTSYLRVLMSNHNNPFSFRNGNVTHLDGTKTSTDEFTTRFNDFLDSLPMGETKPLPEAFTFANKGKMKTLIEDHTNSFSFIGGNITHNSPAPRIDRTGNFIYNGKNWGKREPRWIELKLKNTGYKL